MRKYLIKKIDSILINISFLVQAEGKNITLSKIFCHYEDIINNIESKNNTTIKKCLDVIYNEAWKLDYKTNKYHSVIKYDIIALNKDIKDKLNIN